MRSALLQLVAALAVVGLVTTVAPAADDAASVAAVKVAAVKIDRLVVEPSPVVLHGADDMVQLLVTAQMADGSQRDVTHAAQYRVANQAIVSVGLGQLKSSGDGGTKIHIAIKQPGQGAPGQATEVAADLDVKVEQFGVERPINFANDIIPVLTKFGCNSGGCHGKATGQNGFKLSLLGFDAAGDYEAIVKQAHGRRVFPGRAGAFAAARPKPRRESFMAAVAGLKSTARRPSCCAAGSSRGCRSASRMIRTSCGSKCCRANACCSRGSQQQLRVVATYSDDSTRRRHRRSPIPGSTARPGRRSPRAVWPARWMPRAKARSWSVTWAWWTSPA